MNCQDLGPVNNAKVDYPDYAHRVAKKVKMNKNNRGILIGNINFSKYRYR